MVIRKTKYNVSDLKCHLVWGTRVQEAHFKRRSYTVLER